jgi:leader peptidase (prepilin peptidase) / N-methyltransferase
MVFAPALLITLFLFLLGAAVGSFLNVVIYRSIRDESWVKGRSKCDHCGKRIAWFDNIPVFSYLVLQGKSRCCHQAIPLSYPVIEGITGVLFVWWYWVGSLFFQLTTNPLQTIQPLFWLLVGVLLVLIFFADLMYMIIPDIAVGALVLLTILYRIYLTVSGVMRLEDLLYAVMALVLAVSLIGGIWLVTQGKGMGFGDVKFVVPMALLLGWPKLLIGLFVAFLCGGVVGSFLLALRKKHVGDVVPFGPFLVAGTGVALVWGDMLWYRYMTLL